MRKYYLLQSKRHRFSPGVTHRRPAVSEKRFLNRKGKKIGDIGNGVSDKPREHDKAAIMLCKEHRLGELSWNLLQTASSYKIWNLTVSKPVKPFGEES